LFVSFGFDAEAAADTVVVEFAFSFFRVHYGNSLDQVFLGK
jgi:hypothetical protein